MLWRVIVVQQVKTKWNFMENFIDVQAEAVAWGGKKAGRSSGRGDREQLRWLGERLDFRSKDFGGDTLGMWLARAMLRVRDRRGQPVPLEANTAQREYERKRGQRNIVLKARQMGISTWVAGRFFLKTITQPGTLTVQVAHNREAAEQIFRIVHRFYEQLPEGLRDGALRASRVNTGQILFPKLDSEYRVESAADVNAGRGITIQNLHCSEVARWGGDTAATMASLRAALVPDGELVLESTPNGAHGCFYEEWTRAEETGFVRHFFPWWMERAYASTPVDREEWTDEERVLAEEHGLAPEQIGYRRQLQRSFRQVAAQEYAENPEACFLASGDCVFDLDGIARRIQEARAPFETRLNGALWIWYPPQPERQYIIGLDPAGGGTDGDYAALQVIERETGLQCAELRAHMDPRKLAQHAAELGREYNDALLVVERNNHGHAVLAYLHTTQRYLSLYEQRGMPGCLTTAASRPEMIERIDAALTRQADIFSSTRLLGECRTFVRHADGRTGAAHGAHDDCVMAMAMAMHARAERVSARG